MEGATLAVAAMQAVATAGVEGAVATAGVEGATPAAVATLVGVA